MITTKSGLNPENFASVLQGKKTALYVLENKQGMEVCVTNYGGTILSIMAPDRDGKLANVVLCYDSLDACLHAPEPYLGVAIGRYGNRIAEGKFTLDGVQYQLAINNGKNHLHGGPTGFNFRVWDVVKAEKNVLVMSRVSEDGEEGFPGNLKVEMTYTLTEDNALQLEYRATTDKKTIVNLTNHSFFNLAGSQDVTPTVYNHVLTMNCKQYIPIADAGSIPTGEIADVKGTPFDFLTPHTIGERIDADNDQIKYGTGYDHCFCVDQDSADQRGMKGLKLAATVEEPNSGRVMKTYTNEPGVQLYTGNFLSGFAGALGHKFPSRSAVCFESQKYPDSINHPNFQQPILCPGEQYYSVCVYAFSVK